MAETSYKCPDCGKEFDKPGKVTFHRIAVHGYRAAGKSGGSKASSSRTASGPAVLSSATEAQIEEDCRKAVGYVQGLGGMLKMSIAPHAGTAIMGVEVQKGQPTEGAYKEDGRYWYVRSRAVMALPTLAGQAKRNAQIYQVVRAWIAFCESGQVVEAIAGVAAAAAVDVGVPREFGLKLGPIPMQPIPLVIPDVLEWVDAELAEIAREEAAAPSYPRAPGEDQAPAGELADEAELVAGGLTGT